MWWAMVLQALTGFAGSIIKFQEEKRQFKYSKKYNKQTAASIREQENYDIAATSRRIFEERQAASEKKAAIKLQTAEARAFGEVAAEAGGVRGISVNSLVDSLSRQGARGIGAVDANLKSAQQTIYGHQLAINRGATAQIRSLSRVRSPSLTGLFIDILGQGAGAAATGISASK